MRRILLALCMIVSTGACVKLDKPENVAACANTPQGCKNEPKVSPVDSGKEAGEAGAGYIEGPSKDAAKPPLDGAKTPGDTTPIVPVPDDAGNLPDGLIADTPLLSDTPEFADTPTIAIDDGPLPDVLVVVPADAPDGPAVIVPADGPKDLPVDGLRLDVPILADGPADAPVDTRDAPPDLPDTRDVYRDVAVGMCAPAGVIQPAGTVCRAAVGPCDIDETCDGVTADCPADKLATAGASCRASAGDCDIAETCSGTGPDCPPDGFKQAGTVCRAAAGVCDVAESCTGSSAICPVDSLAASSTVCRASTDSNKCDPAESCTGSSVSCPSDVIYANPATPSTPSAASGTNQVSVSWSAAVGATGYNVKRSTTSGSGYTTLGSAPTTSASPYVDSGIAAGTYYYVVSSINTVATCESANSSQVTANPVGPCSPPTVPAVTATPGNNTVVLTWPASPGAVSYTIARSQTAGTGYGTLGVPTPANGTTYTDSQVVNGTTYYYVVTASNGTCSSGNSTEVSASPACNPPSAPAAPTATATMTSVTLTWNAPLNATTYQVKRSTTSGSGYVPLQNVGVTTFTDTTVVTGTTYYYVVAASNGFCSSANSPQVAVTPSCIPPSAPTVTATPSNNQVSLSWTAPQGATSYAVYRGATSGGESSTAVASPTTTNYVDTSVSNGSIYYYVVKASNGSCSSVNSTEVSATPVCTSPSAPGTLTATPGDAQVGLSWVATASWGSAGTNTYSISRKTGSGGTYSVIVAAQAGTSYTDTTGLTNATTYYYKVSASNGSCSSGFDAEVPATPVATCSQGVPGTPTLTVNPSSQIQVTWTASSPVPTGGYDIGRSTTNGSGYANAGHVANTTVTYTDSGAVLPLAIGTTYYYVITANGSCTAASSQAQIALTCQAPAVPTWPATPITNSAGAITITWNQASGATAYTVWRSTSSGSGYSAISTNQTALNYTDPAAGLTNGTLYYYKVSATNTSGTCPASPTQSTAVSLRSCTIPTTPTITSARRSGNKQVTLLLPSGPALYNVLKSTTNGSGYASIGTTTGTTYPDNNAANGTPYYYVVTASSDTGGNCSSGNSAQAAVPSCTVLSGASVPASNFNTTNEYCIVSCDTIAQGNWQDGNMGTRTLYVNTVQTASGAALPPLANGGRAFYWTASSTGRDTYINWWNATAVTCP